jgi:hypothetical protein
VDDTTSRAAHRLCDRATPRSTGVDGNGLPRATDDKDTPMRSLTRSTLLAAAAVAVIAAPAAAQDATGTVTVVHGVPGATVDVYVNGDLTLEDFEPTTITDPLTLPAGDYEVEIYAADADPAAGDPIISGSTSLPADANASLVAHPDADGNPVLGVFVNNTAPLEAGQARLSVRHTAAAPAVDVRADGEVLAAGVTNGQGADFDVPAGDYTADVVVAGTGDIAIGPADLSLAEGTNTVVYAYGTADAGYDFLVQSITGLHSAPAGVPAGSAGLAADGFPLWVAGLMALGALGIAVPAVARRRS